MRFKLLELGFVFALISICSASSVAKAEDLITAPLDELLPSRDDIPTEWYTGGSGEITLTEPGFVEGKSTAYDRIFGEYSEMNMVFYVYRFSDAITATAYYDKKVNEIKSGGGYTEIPISGVFAVFYDMGVEEEGFSWGVTRNIVFEVNVYNDYILEDPKDELVTFTNLEKTIVPEFPSLFILAIFMTASLMAVIILKRRYRPDSVSS